MEFARILASKIIKDVQSYQNFGVCISSRTNQSWTQLTLPFVQPDLQDLAITELTHSTTTPPNLMATGFTSSKIGSRGQNNGICVSPEITKGKLRRSRL